MRVWLDPEQLATRRPDGDRRDEGLQEQNVQVAAGRIGQPPVPDGRSSFSSRSTRWAGCWTPEQFDDIVIKTGRATGRSCGCATIGTTREASRRRQELRRELLLRRRAERRAGRLQLPGSNALATAEAVRDGWRN